jgi:geranylgeranyl diphosphate synthase type I
LEAHFAELEPGFAGVNAWGKDSLARLFEYTSGGKMLRGSLVSFGHDMYGGGLADEAAAAGAAMELFQSAFLVHDDIMDRDETRRGKPAIHAQYARVAAGDGVAEAGHMGEALGICAGDLSLFIAFGILAGLKAEAGAKERLLSLFCRELEYVGLAQMADVYQSAGEDSPEAGDIIKLYRYKTGRYTFSLPFAAGLILAGKDGELVEQFTLLGEKLGVLFQIKDDELGLWADEKELGKPVGSDISENKKTLHRHILFKSADAEAREKLRCIFGKPSPCAEDIAFVRGQMEKFGVREKTGEICACLYTDAKNIIEALPPGAGPVWKKRLEELLDYNMGRTR